MTLLPLMTTSPTETPSRGTSAPSGPTTRIGSAITIATPWRESSRARSPGSSPSHPVCHWHTVCGP